MATTTMTLKFDDKFNLLLDQSGIEGTVKRFEKVGEQEKPHRHAASPDPQEQTGGRIVLVKTGKNSCYWVQMGNIWYRICTP